MERSMDGHILRLTKGLHDDDEANDNNCDGN